MDDDFSDTEGAGPDLISPPQKTVASALLVDAELKLWRERRAKKDGKKAGRSSTADLISAYSGNDVAAENTLSEGELSRINKDISSSLDDLLYDCVNKDGIKDVPVVPGDDDNDDFLFGGGSGENQGSDPVEINLKSSGDDFLNGNSSVKTNPGAEVESCDLDELLREIRG